MLRPPTFGDATSELQLARSVARLGAEEANKRRNPDPFENLRARASTRGIGDHVLADRAGAGGDLPRVPAPSARAARPQTSAIPAATTGSSSGALSATGKPVVANDPHREVTNPSLRYIVHLNAPGWNVAGASRAAVSWRRARPQRTDRLGAHHRRHRPA